MDFEKLAQNALGIIKAAAPLVGLSEEVAAVEAIVRNAEELVDNLKPVLTNDSQQELQAGLEQLRADAKAKVKKATDKL